MFKPLAIAFAVLCLAAPHAYAQFETAALVGTVTDSSGALVADATITVTSIETGVSQTRRTDQYGSFELVTLRIGTYVVMAEKPGFAVALVDNLRLTVGARQRIELTMRVGQVTERIEVTAAPSLLETDTSDRAQIITGEQTRALQLNGRE